MDQLPDHLESIRNTLIDGHMYGGVEAVNDQINGLHVEASAARILEQAAQQLLQETVSLPSELTSAVHDMAQGMAHDSMVADSRLQFALRVTYAARH